MITARAFAGKHYAVYGLARSGLATVEALLASGARVTAWDGKEEARDRLLPGTGRGTAARSGVVEGAPISAETPLHHPADGPPPRTGEDLEIADLDTADLTQFDSLVVTPGLPLNRHPIAQRARDAAVEIIGDIELFARARPELPPHKVVGITGTNGKSTTTALVHHILKTAGVPTTMGGNIGLPILSQDPLPEGGVYVLELSSYQIDLSPCTDISIPPWDIGVLLNITPDHLDRYRNMDAYSASKARLVAGSRTAVLGTSDKYTRSIAVYLRREQVGLTQIFETSHPDQSEWPSLQGPHNLQNALAAIKVSWLLGVHGDQIAEGLRTYPGLPHRMERIRERNGVLFVNDSKGTNTEAVAPALAAYPRIRWILGGYAKTESLGDTEKHLDHVVSAYTIGQAGPMLARLLRDKGVTVTECETLENAVNHAAKDSQAGDVVLLSPACASQDQFRDFEDRGNRFRELVGAL